MFYYGFDIYYVVLILPALLVAIWAQYRVNSTFSQFSQVRNARGLTGAQAARMILDRNGLTQVAVERVAGRLTDHYDPKSNVIRLSQGVYDSDSVAAVGVAAHEAGHAVQYAQNYFPIRIRSAMIPVTRIGSWLSFPLLLLGILFSFQGLIQAGILLFSTVTVFQLVTLPVEFNASSRALATLEESWMLDQEELRGAKKVLSAAAMTYVAALLQSLAQLIRLLAIFGGRNRRD